MSESITPKVVIKTDGICGQVFINDEKVSGITGVRFVHEAGDIPKLQLDVISTDITIETDVVPELPDIYKPYYKEIEPM